MEFRNHILNSRFIYKALRHGDENIPAVAYMMKRELCYKSLIYKWIAFNPLLNRIINLDSKKMKTEVLLLRYENVKNDTLGHTGVSNAIRVDPSLKLSSVLTWNGLEDSKIKLNIIQWRLGRIAYHQLCLNCHRAWLSRQHALECSHVDEQLLKLFPNTDIQQFCNLLDSILNNLHFVQDIQILKTVSSAIQNIKGTCLHQN